MFYIVNGCIRRLDSMYDDSWETRNCRLKPFCSQKWNSQSFELHRELNFMKLVLRHLLNVWWPKIFSNVSYNPSIVSYSLKFEISSPQMCSAWMSAILLSTFGIKRKPNLTLNSVKMSRVPQRTLHRCRQTKWILLVKILNELMLITSCVQYE